MSEIAGPGPASEVEARGAVHTWTGRRAGDAAGRWGGAAELLADVRTALRFAGLLAAAGIPAGLLWWLLAPRQDYRVLADGLEPLGDTSAELRAADDGVFVLVMAGLGLLAGLAAWFLRRRRGVTMLVAVAAGAGLAGIIARQLGEQLGQGPSRTELSQVGATVTTPLELASTPALTVAPFVAVLVYVVATLLAAGEDLGRGPADDAGSAA